MENINSNTYKNQEDNRKHFSKPYMGNLTSAQIGNMARAGQLGGEMVKRMIEKQEQQLMNEYDQNNSLE